VLHITWLQNVTLGNTGDANPGVVDAGRVEACTEQMEMHVGDCWWLGWLSLGFIVIFEAK
jgi:hypothetical protein